LYLDSLYLSFLTSLSIILWYLFLNWILYSVVNYLDLVISSPANINLIILVIVSIHMNICLFYTLKSINSIHFQIHTFNSCISMHNVILFKNISISTYWLKHSLLYTLLLKFHSLLVFNTFLINTLPFKTLQLTSNIYYLFSYYLNYLFYYSHIFILIFLLSLTKCLFYMCYLHRLS